MLRYDVTDAGYKLLEKTGLDKKIEEKWNNIVMDLLPRGAIVDDWEVEEILEKKNLSSERRKAVERWQKGDSRYEQDPRGLFMVSGSVTDSILTKEEVDKIRQSGVVSLEELDGLLAAYCLTREADNPMGSRSYYTWRSEGLKTRIYGDTHGDLQINQVQTKSKNENELFGLLPNEHVNADYGYWPVIATTALKYADTVGIEIPEAKNWQELMKQYGWDGTIKAPAGWGVGYDRFVPEYFENIIVQLPDKTDIRQVKKMFFGQMWPNANHEVFYLPVIDSEQNLVFFSNSGIGESVELAPFGDPIDCYPRVHIPKSDAGHLFKGAVNGIMTHQSRTRPEILAYVFWQYGQIKAGKTEDEIRKDSRQYDGY